MTAFNELTGYEKGLAARALLRQLIKQGRFAEPEGSQQDPEIVIPVKRWQLQLLACFSDDSELTEDRHLKKDSSRIK